MQCLSTMQAAICIFTQMPGHVVQPKLSPLLSEMESYCLEKVTALICIPHLQTEELEM